MPQRERMARAQDRLLGRAKVTWSAGSMAKIASGLLPAAQRERYAEEFANEPWELAETGVGRWRQAVHAARLLLKAPHLYLTLRAPHPSNRHGRDDRLPLSRRRHLGGRVCTGREGAGRGGEDLAVLEVQKSRIRLRSWRHGGLPHAPARKNA
jgi:hypothetical protein